MTFDDGELTIFRLEDTAETGCRPDLRLIKKASCYYGEEEVFYRRFLAAKQVGESIDRLVHIWPEAVEATDIVTLGDGEQYRITQIQRGKKNGLDIMWLSLERSKEQYECACEA